MSTKRPLTIRLGSLVLVCLAGYPATAQDQNAEVEPLQLVGIVPAGARTQVTDNWSTLRVELRNLAHEGRQARVAVFYPEQADVQYTRDIFVPARSVVATWMSIGPAAPQNHGHYRDVKVLLYDRTSGTDRLILPPGTEVERSRPLIFRSREPITAVLLDDPPDPGPVTNTQPGEDETVTLARCVREAANLSEYVATVQERFLPPEPGAFDGIDVLILASNRLANDPVGRQAIRRWVEQGGSLWVPLDRVDTSVIAPFLGEECDFTVIDRVRVETIRFHQTADDLARAETRSLEQPVEMVRVALGASDVAIHHVNGWPASFARHIGRGQVLFTTLGARGWHQPRGPRDPPPPFRHFRDSPAPINQLVELALRVHPRTDRGDPDQVPVDALRDMAIQEVGYTIINRGTVAAIFATFVVAVLGLGLFLRRSGRSELIGWLAPVLAIVVAATFVGLGESSRRAVPPTVSVAALVEAVPGSNEAGVTGVIALYRPQSGPVSAGTEKGALLELDDRGLEGQTRRRIETDFDSWHWEGLSLPAGIRTGSFRSTISSTRFSAVARFGPEGLSGRIEAGPFSQLADSLLVTPSKQSLPVRFTADNGFTARSEDVLPAGQFLTAAVLTDHQQRRQAIYRTLVGKSFPRRWEDRPHLLAWADPGPIPVGIQGSERIVGAALLAMPLTFERPGPGTTVNIPRAFIPHARLIQGRPRSVALEGNGASELEMQFELPASVLPLTVEGIRLFAKVRAPGRRFTVSGVTDTGPVTIHEAENPLDPIEITISDPRFLRVYPGGVLRLTLRVSDQIREEAAGQKGSNRRGRGREGSKGNLPDNPPDLAWTIESLGIDVAGRTEATR